MSAKTPDLGPVSQLRSDGRFSALVAPKIGVSGSILASPIRQIWHRFIRRSIQAMIEHMFDT
jgi:hypothetical protein